MAAWTKGPLTVRQDEKSSRWAFVIAPDGRTIADVWNVPGTQGAQALADATLYAAAPDLAEACEAALEHMEWSTEQGHAAYLQLTAALAKARGES